ncbi:hypothetical protein WG907_01405 [Sphingobium sp. AN558]|uniref:hypothetical protein n=1 Tax=Sphingobium sp. AN558 TaxID=3133442 RepID=UPI0030C1CCCB
MWARANQKAHAQNLNRLATAFKALLDKPLDKITGLDVERWRAGEIERGLSLQTINRDISSIKAFNRAVDWELIGTNPLAKVKKSRTDDCLKVWFLSDAEKSVCAPRSMPAKNAAAPNAIPPIIGGGKGTMYHCPACARSCSPII